MTHLTFCGAAGTVTGSCSLLETGTTSCVVDCGLFQGNKTVRALNEAELPFDARKVDFCLLTHAHSDHAGLLPKLLKAGFGGPIYATQATADLLDFMLLDSARIQESDNERRNRRRQRNGEPTRPPLFDRGHAEATIAQIQTVDYDTWFEPAKSMRVRYSNAGHILGSASIEVAIAEADRHMRLLFSGDLGPQEKVFHPEPNAEQGFDYVVCESTYGDRERDDYTLAGRREALLRELRAGLKRGGNVVIPCFAVERSQELLHDIGALLHEGKLDNAVVFLDSPLAAKVTGIFEKHAHALEDVELPASKLFRDPRFHITQSVEESQAINRVERGAIIISASGMADAGRILHHLKRNIWRKEATVLFVGYMAPGTTGSVIQGGARKVRIHGKEYRIAAKVRRIGNYSAHADQGELADWIMARTPIVGGLFLNHGNDRGRKGLRKLLGERGLPAAKVFLPEFDERFELTAGTPASKGRAAARIPERDIETDWNNDYAALLVDLSDHLDAAPDDGARRETLARLRRALGA